jgi:hypothetical protein
MKEHALNSLNNFIGAWYYIDTDICDELIKFHTDSPTKRQGETSKGLQLDSKDSTDVDLPFDGEISKKYIKYLQTATDNYIEKYPWSNRFAPWVIREHMQVQHYKPGGAYFGVHSERTSDVYPTTLRHLAFMTYLNNVTDGGETEWVQQNLKVKPEKGLTIIWPVDWTFAHRGIPSPTQEKYIVTGWYSYVSSL